MHQSCRRGSSRSSLPGCVSVCMGRGTCIAQADGISGHWPARPSNHLAAWSTRHVARFLCTRHPCHGSTVPRLRYLGYCTLGQGQSLLGAIFLINHPWVSSSTPFTFTFARSAPTPSTSCTQLLCHLAVIPQILCLASFLATQLRPPLLSLTSRATNRISIAPHIPYPVATCPLPGNQPFISHRENLPPLISPPSCA